MLVTKMRVLLDTNIWISGLLWGGIIRQIILLAESKQITLIVSERLLNEITNTLSYPKLQAKLIQIGQTPDTLIETVQNLVEICSISTTLEVPNLRDANDLFILETAVSSNVQFIITGDQDLLCLGKILSISIVTAREFLDFYSSNPEGN